MFEFKVASESAVAKSQNEEETPEEFGILGHTFQARRPIPGEINVLFSTQGAGEGTRAVWTFLRAVLLEPDEENPKRAGWRVLRQLVSDGKFPPQLLFGGDEDNEEGVVDHIVSAWAGRPTPTSSDSSPSPSDDGERSTGRVRGKGSISSTSD